MILIISTTQGHGGGAERVLCELLTGWPAEWSPLTVVSPPNSSVYDCAMDKGLKLIALPSPRDALIENISALLKIRHKLPHCDLVHAWSARGFELAWLVGLKQKVVSSGTLHDHPHAYFHGRFRQYIMKRMANRLDSMVCVSNAVAMACQEFGYRCPLPVIYNGLNDVQRNKKGKDSPVRIGFLGMNAVGKGFHLILDWIVKTDDKSVKWQLYGEVSPTLAGAVKRMQDECDSRSVELKGRQPSKDIFNEIDILVHASTNFDSLPTVLIEAARASIPALASDLGGASEIVEDGKTGFLFSPQNPDDGFEKLQRVIDSLVLRADLGKNARDIYKQKFAIEVMAREYHQFWDFLIQH